MGTTNTLVTEIITTIERDDSEISIESVPTQGAKEPRARYNPRVQRPTQYTRVKIANPAGFGVFGLLKSVSRGVIQVLTTIHVPIRCPIQITIAGCRPASAEAFYSLQRSSVCHVGVVVSTRRKPTLLVGELAVIQDLEPPFDGGRGIVVDVGNSAISIFCKTEIESGAWVRIESNGWILFGVVREVEPTNMLGRRLQIHLEAAFPADGEATVLRSNPLQQICERRNEGMQIEGDI